MKHTIVRRTFFLATFFLSLAVVAPAFSVNGGGNGGVGQGADEQNGPTCSNIGLAGDWAYSLTGTLFLPPSGTAAPIIAVGKGSFDRNGNYSGTQTTSINGAAEQDTLTGTRTVNPDCTGTLAVKIYSMGTLVRSAVVALVFDDNEREFRGIFTSVVLEQPIATAGHEQFIAYGTPVLSSITENGRKVFPGKE